MSDETCCGACGYPVHATKEMACDSCRQAADRIEDLTEQLAAASQDTKALEDELEMQEQEACMMENDYIKLEKERDALEANLAKAVEALERAKASIENGGGGGVVDVVWLDGPCPETLCDFIDATLAEIKGESQDGMG